MAQEYIEQLFLQEKTTLALLAIEDCNSAYTAEVAKIIYSTFAHTTKVALKFEEHGDIEVNDGANEVAL